MAKTRKNTTDVDIIFICDKHSEFIFSLSIQGILEFNPQLAGQDITPANLEFGTIVARRHDRREKSFSGASMFHGGLSCARNICCF